MIGSSTRLSCVTVLNIMFNILTPSSYIGTSIFCCCYSQTHSDQVSMYVLLLYSSYYFVACTCTCAPTVLFALYLEWFCYTYIKQKLLSLYFVRLNAMACELYSPDYVCRDDLCAHIKQAWVHGLITQSQMLQMLFGPLI